MKDKLFGAVGAFKARTGEFLDGGIYYCEKCKRPVQEFVDGVGLVRVECDCKRQERERKAAADLRAKREEKRQEAFERKKSKRFDFTFASDDRRNSTASDLLKDYCENFEERRKSGMGYILHSPQNGGGKTFLACAVANELIDKGYRVIVTDFLTLRDKLYDPKAFAFVSKSEVLNRLCGYDLVVIDDLGAEQSTEFMLEVEYRVIDSLTDSLVPIILTTNYTLSELKATTDINKRRVFDRIFGACALVSIDPPAGKSRRIEKCIELTKANLT